MLASELAKRLLFYVDEYGDYPVVLNDEDGWPVGELEIGEDDNAHPAIVVYDVAH